MKRFIEQEAQEKAEEIMIKVGMEISSCGGILVPRVFFWGGGGGGGGGVV
jgi:hypothetical protein